MASLSSCSLLQRFFSEKHTLPVASSVRQISPGPVLFGRQRRKQRSCNFVLSSAQTDHRSPIPFIALRHISLQGLFLLYSRLNLLVSLFRLLDSVFVSCFSFVFGFWFIERCFSRSGQKTSRKGCLGSLIRGSSSLT